MSTNQQNTQQSAGDDILMDGGHHVSVPSLSNTSSNMHSARRLSRALSVTATGPPPVVSDNDENENDSDGFSSSLCTSECESIAEFPDCAVDDYEDDVTDFDGTSQKNSSCLSEGSSSTLSSASSASSARPLSLPIIHFAGNTFPAINRQKKPKSRSRSMSELNRDIMPPFKIHKHLNSDSLTYRATEVSKKKSAKKCYNHVKHHTSVISSASVPSPDFAVPPPSSGYTSQGESFKFSSSGSNSTSQVSEYASQPPPVNSLSLKEIDLQEIFKNPQLRHDIVFDPQLQFRPNLDGERGRRKRSMAEKYWDSINIEFEEILAVFKLRQVVFDADLASFPSPLPPPPPPPVARHDNNSRLPLLFTTLKEILISLLPTKDRAYANSVLDCDLIMQQLRKNSLDFLSFANWLAQIFKAHCAPMRDSWVDQMVNRIDLGVTSQSPKRIVEGIRMIFAILEAMKLDVANHQIRTLRPLLVSSAVEFEQGYYSQYASRGKLNISDSLQWFADCTEAFKAETPSLESIDTNKQAFLFGFLKLITCAGADIVSEFPSAFGFDNSRLSSLRAELRKIVCLNLCVLLYQQMLRQANSSNNGINLLTATELANAMSVEAISKLKQDIIAIVSDSTGNLKWTKNTSGLGLELAKRVDNLVNKTTSLTAPPELTAFASNWLANQLQPKSDLYAILEKRARRFIFEVLSKNMTLIRSLDGNDLQSLSEESLKQALAPTMVMVESECMALASRMIVLSRFHWAVFGKQYVSHVSCKSTDDKVQQLQLPLENGMIEVTESVTKKNMDVRSKQVKC